MKNNQIHEISHLLMSHYVHPDDVAIDMTMGNGHDTLHLAKLAKHVYAFDIQDQALQETKKRLDEHRMNNVTLIKDSHVHVLNYVSSFKYVVFNLGYLPKGDKTITTHKDETLETLSLILNHLPYLGCVQLMIYPGHSEGMNESIAIDAYLSKLPINGFKIVNINLPYQDNHPPYIIWIQKIKKDGK